MRSVLTFSLLLACVACGDDDRPAGDAGPVRDATTGDDGGTPGTDAGPGTDGGPATDGGPTTGGYQGTVSLTHSTMLGAEQTVLGGFFTDEPDIRTGALPGCTIVRTVGACTLANCPSVDPSLDGGTLTADVDGTMVASAVNSAFGYFAMTPGRVFDPGDVITLSTTGAVVPAFTGDALAPAPLTTTLPTTFTPGEPLVFSWDGAVVADEVEVGLSGAGEAVVCAVPASAGTLTVDASITADLDGAILTTIKSLVITSVTAGTYRIAVIAGDSTGGTVTAE